VPFRKDTPYEGKTLRGWPETVLSRGRIVVRAGALCVDRGSGEFIRRGTPKPVSMQHSVSPRTHFFKTLVR
jgi:dihydropyrimidinase